MKFRDSSSAGLPQTSEIRLSMLMHPNANRGPAAASFRTFLSAFLLRPFTATRTPQTVGPKHSRRPFSLKSKSRWPPSTGSKVQRRRRPRADMGQAWYAVSKSWKRRHLPQMMEGSCSVPRASGFQAHTVPETWGVKATATGQPWAASLGRSGKNGTAVLQPAQIVINLRGHMVSLSRHLCKVSP